MLYDDEIIEIYKMGLIAGLALATKRLEEEYKLAPVVSEPKKEKFKLELV